MPIPSVTGVPLIGDYWVNTALRLQLWCGGCYTFLKKQQQGLMGLLHHTGHDGDEGAQRETSGFSRA